ncbi:Integrase, catalytic core protein [Phytophthora megakarya]|uniref:Integrase, catalytic core protein n=1 Tax=Phytophthora megakarya TaxID=4795 RepID=A0A225VFF7_9STRA|nr:Integrase, catalytic core protein [Phytophthora megakarya]
MQAWNTLREYYIRTALHSRVTMTRRLHEFKMENGSTMSNHLDAFDELVVGLQTLGESVDEARQLVVLLSSLPAEVENDQDITLNDVKEKLLKEFERLEKKETTERAFKVNAGQFKGGRAYGLKGNSPRKNSGGFKGNCFKCNRVGQLKRACPEQNGASGNGKVFTVSEGQTVGWLIDTGATAHMTPHRADLFEYEALDTGIEVTIADGKKLRVVGRGTVRLTGLDSVRIMMKEVLYIPGLDRRLLSVGKLAGRGLHVEFQRSSCVIWGKARTIASRKKAGKAYILDYQQEEARFVQYPGVNSEWELWHARIGHCNKNPLAKTQLATTGIPTVERGVKTLCGGCMKGK